MCFSFPLENMVSELKINAKDTAWWSAMYVCLIHYVVMERHYTNSNRKYFSRNVNCLREMFHAVNMMFS